VDRNAGVTMAARRRRIPEIAAGSGSSQDRKRPARVNGASSGWACHHQARVTGTSLLQVAVCDAGNGDAIAAKVADQFAARVKG